MINTKFIILFISFASFISCGGASQKEEVSGARIKGHADFNNQWLYLVKPDPWLVKADIVDSCLIDGNGNFTLNADVKEIQEFLLSGRGYFLTNVFLEEGFDLKLSVQGRGTKGKGKKVGFEGEGSELNRFWYSMNNRYFRQGGYGKRYKKMVTNYEPMEYQEAYKSYSKEQFEAIDSFVKEAKPSSFFVDWATSFVEYSTASKYYTYLFHKPRLSNSSVNYLSVQDEYYNFLEEIDIKELPKMVHSSYNDFVYFYMVDYKARNLSGIKNTVEASIEFAKNELPETVANIAVGHVIKEMIQSASSRADYNNLRLIMDDFKTWPNTDKYTGFLDVQYAEKAVLAPGSPAPNFTLRDTENNEVSLSDLKGNVVVLDFWGTWCGPCKRELPFSRKIEEEYKDRDDVVFLFVALERGSRAYWKEFVETNSIPGLHLYASNSDKSLAPYKITSVPRYVLLDKDGNIYDAFASRPSQNMKSQIEKVLEL